MWNQFDKIVYVLPLLIHESQQVITWPALCFNWLISKIFSGFRPGEVRPAAWNWPSTTTATIVSHFTQRKHYACIWFQFWTLIQQVNLFHTKAGTDPLNKIKTPHHHRYMKGREHNVTHGDNTHYFIYSSSRQTISKEILSPQLKNLNFLADILFHRSLEKK